MNLSWTQRLWIYNCLHSCDNTSWRLNAASYMPHLLLIDSLLYAVKYKMKYMDGADCSHVHIFECTGRELLQWGFLQLNFPIKCRRKKILLAKPLLRWPCKTWGMAIRRQRFGASKLPRGLDIVSSTQSWISHKLYQSPAQPNPSLSWSPIEMH